MKQQKKTNDTKIKTNRGNNNVASSICFNFKEVYIEKKIYIMRCAIYKNI